ncbi:MAG TPA: CPBP family intramembrane glutamic endopeptidase, partial [Roseiflexaceae bacterium]|nr:CPBP family intramembrane glutamic endopeptidase [Roseiflexaceae bacterium]
IFLPMTVAPALAAITLTGIVDGSSGLRDLFSRMRRWRVAANWYAALLMFPILILGVLLTLAALISPEFAPIFFPAGILIGLFTGFFEETGWMGYAFPKMELKRSPLATALLLGVIHVLWHIVPDYLGASGARGAYWLPHFLAMMLVAMTAMRVLIVWVYVNTRSLLLAQLMHASSTGFLAILDPTSISPASSTLWYAIYGVVLWVVVAVVVAIYGKDLTHRQQHVQLA